MKKKKDKEKGRKSTQINNMDILKAAMEVFIYKHVVSSLRNTLKNGNRI